MISQTISIRNALSAVLFGRGASQGGGGFTLPAFTLAKTNGDSRSASCTARAWFSRARCRRPPLPALPMRSWHGARWKSAAGRLFICKI